MKIGVLREQKPGEGRVALTPAQAHELIHAKHTVCVMTGAGAAAGFPDRDYRQSGCRIVSDRNKLIVKSDLILKVKEPTLDEIKVLKPGQLFFSFLHLAAFPALLKAILKRKLDVLAYETIDISGFMPILKPMSEIAGKLATQIGANLLRRDQGGRGILMGGTDRVAPARVLILGGGVVGTAAARIAIGMGARTTVYEISADRQNWLREHLQNSAQIIGNPSGMTDLVAEADLLVGAVLRCGEKTPVLVTRDQVKKMKRGSVIIDVSVDQGGCIETSEVTTLKRPVVIKYGVLHYGVCNMPGSVPVTSTLALTQESFPYIATIADHGWEGALSIKPELAGALNCSRGEITHPGLKRACSSHR